MITKEEAISKLPLRIAEKINFDLPDSCWEWNASILPTGYGASYKSSTKKDCRAHRLVWEIINGDIENNLWVLHKCDNRKCVNPNHLFLGDRDANTKDMMSKKRQTLGSRNRHAKLTEEQVFKIKKKAAQGERTTDLAKEFNISLAIISEIRGGKIWTHVTI